MGLGVGGGVGRGREGGLGVGTGLREGFGGWEGLAGVWGGFPTRARALGRHSCGSMLRGNVAVFFRHFGIFSCSENL